MVRILYYSQSTHYGLLQNLQHTHMEFMLTKVGIHGFQNPENQNFNVYAGVKLRFVQICPNSEKQNLLSSHIAIVGKLCFSEICVTIPQQSVAY